MHFRSFFYSILLALALALQARAGTAEYSRSASVTTPVTPPEFERFELSLGYNYIHLDKADIEQEHLHGADFSAFFNFNRTIGIGADFMTNFGNRSQFGFDLATRRFFYLGGLRITLWQNSTFRAFTEILAGAVHAELEASSGSFSRTFDDDGFAGAAGGGIDWRFSRHLAWRIIQADYLPTNLGNEWQHNFRASTAIVFSFGDR